MCSAKAYRIEKSSSVFSKNGGGLNSDASTNQAHMLTSIADPRIDEVLQTLRDLKASIVPLQESAQESAESAVDIIAEYKRELADVYKLKSEIDTMKKAIEGTKLEIASLHLTEERGDGMRRVTGELDAVVTDTEHATTTILNVAEEIENQASMIRSMGVAPEQSDVILEKIIQLYEACNFQDLTGQRITKIVRTLGFVEERLDAMIQVWGGIEVFKELEDKAQAFEGAFTHCSVDSTLLNGPKLAGQDDNENIHVGQDAIDSLFD
jgi:chemotaxis protein CheZ